MGAAALLTAVSLVLKLTAGEDPAKIHRAALWNPVLVGKVIGGLGRELFAARRARTNGQ